MKLSDRSPEEIQAELIRTAARIDPQTIEREKRREEIMKGGGNEYADPDFGAGKESEEHREISELSREVNRNMNLLDKNIVEREKKVEETLHARMWEISETDRLEEKRAKQLKNNHEMKENFSIEVDNLMAHQQYFKAAKLYAKKQVDLSLPDWFRTLEEMIRNTRSTGHSNKLRWRSKACAFLKRCILETEDDIEAVQSRITMRDLVLKINHFNAAQLISHAERVKEAYIDHCQLHATHLGKSSKLLRESDDNIDRHSIVPLVRTDWSEKLDDADTARKLDALGDTASWSTVSRPITLTASEVSELFAGGADRLAPRVLVPSTGRERDACPGGTTPAVQIEGMTGATLLDPPQAIQSKPKAALKTIPDITTAGAIKPGGAAYQVHPPGLTQAQSQALLRMRSAAAMGNFELVRSIFLTNYDTPRMCKEGKLGVGRRAPTMDVFRILMMAFKNAPELRFEDAFETFDLCESYGLTPDTSLYNIMMRACERESRWRRVLAMYRDLVQVHKQVPNVQTFDIIVDCCRHSLEEPSVIFDELRKLDLPSDYCYKAALCNAGNRIPSQVLYETMHNVADAPLPTDGRFERHVKRDKDAAMRLHGILPPPNKDRVAHYWHKSKTKGTEFVKFSGKAGKPAFDEDNSTIGTYEETHSLGGADDGRTYAGSESRVAHDHNEAMDKGDMSRTVLRDSSLAVADTNTGGLGTRGTSNRNFAVGDVGNSDKPEPEAEAEALSPNMYAAAALTLTLGGDMEQSTLDQGRAPLSLTGGGGGNTHVLSQMVDSLDKEEAEHERAAVADSVITGRMLNDKVDEYQFKQLTHSLKQLLPATSPVRTRGFGKTSDTFVAQIYRGLPTEGHERKHMVDTSASFMQSLKDGGVKGCSSIGQLEMVMPSTGSIAVGEAAFSPSQSLELEGGAAVRVEGKEGVEREGGSPASEAAGANETAFLKDVVGAWKEKDDGRYHDHHTILEHHHRHAKGDQKDEEKSGSESERHGAAKTANESSSDNDPTLAALPQNPYGAVGEVSYLDNEGSVVHYHDGIELEKHQYTVPYSSPTPAMAPTLPDGSQSHEQVLAELGRWREAKKVQEEEAALVELASEPIPSDSLTKLFDEGSGTTSYRGRDSLTSMGAGERGVAASRSSDSRTEQRRAHREKRVRNGPVASSRFSYNRDVDLRERREKKERRLREAQELEETRSIAASILSEKTVSHRTVVDDDGTVNSYHSKEAQMNAALEAKAQIDARRPFRTRTNQPLQKRLLKMPQQKSDIMRSVAETIVHGGDDPASRFRRRMRQKGT